MGVTTHFFAIQPAAFDGPPTLAALLDQGAIDEELRVQPRYTEVLRLVPSWFEDNKVWYRNLDAELAWMQARAAVPERPRARLDGWLSHLFWTGPHDRAHCPCGLGPRKIADQEHLYDPELVAHIAQLQCDPLNQRALDALWPAFAATFPEGPPSGARSPWMFTAEGFCHLVEAWSQVFRQVPQEPGWGALRWVWL